MVTLADAPIGSRWRNRRYPQRTAIVLAHERGAVLYQAVTDDAGDPTTGRRLQAWPDRFLAAWRAIPDTLPLDTDGEGSEL